MSRDYMKNKILTAIEDFKISNTSESQKYEYLNKATQKIRCFCCLDTKEQWDYRESPMAWMDGHGKYDIVHCCGCSKGGYIRPTSSYAGYYRNGDDSDIKGRLDELYEMGWRLAKIETEEKEQNLDKLHEEWENKPTPLWSYGANDIIKESSKVLEIEIAASKLADQISKAIQIANGNLFELANLVKETTLNLNYSSMNNNTEHKEVRCDKPDKWGNATYILLDYKKNSFIEEASCCFPWCKYYIDMAELSLKYRIIKPRNHAARDKCNYLLNSEIESMLRTSSSNQIDDNFV